uniref:Uncharacterized protein n=1 Tax=Oryza sativa subsp. japonica TaxID=39947 RepID=Q69II8_ORYSJ|nr:hypothetical protein [Oryza sativa Japonica Group]BAD36732.1 hypothetical protein [Oryza sativa Japonica Group]
MRQLEESYTTSQALPTLACAGPRDRRPGSARDRSDGAAATWLGSARHKAGRPAMARAATADGAKAAATTGAAARPGAARREREGNRGGGMPHREWPARRRTTANGDGEPREDNGGGRTSSGRP